VLNLFPDIGKKGKYLINLLSHAGMQNGFKIVKVMRMYYAMVN
jgi:hypothetical protein